MSTSNILNKYTVNVQGKVFIERVVHMLAAFQLSYSLISLENSFLIFIKKSVVDGLSTEELQ